MLKGRMYEFIVNEHNKIQRVLGTCIDDSHDLVIVGINEYGLEYKKTLVKEDVDYHEIKLEKYEEEIRELFSKIYTDYRFNICSTLCYKYSTETNQKQKALLSEIILKLGFVTRNQFERYIIENTGFDSVRILEDKLELSKTDVIKKNREAVKHEIKIKDREKVLDTVVNTIESGFDDENIYYVQTIYYKLDTIVNIDTARKICESFN